MTEQKKTFGQAVDLIIEVLEQQEMNSRPLILVTIIKLMELEKSVLSGLEKKSKSNDDFSSSTIPEKPIGFQMDIKTLKEEKNPITAIEMACVMAFYLKEYAPSEEKRSEVSNDDVEKYFNQAGFPLPTVPGQMLLNAKKAGYFDQIGIGKYKLNPVGHNLVAHGLPKKGKSDKLIITRKRKSKSNHTKSKRKR